MSVYAVVLAGGKGTRFWPMSTASRPKQLLKLFHDKTLLDLTLARISSLCVPGHIYISTRQDLAKPILESNSTIRKKQLIIEPEGRNSGPAILLAALIIHQQEKDATMLVLPSDHYIPEVKPYLEAVTTGIAFLDYNPRYLLTFGIKPTRIETGYGYIELATLMYQESHVPIFHAAGFREKPDLETAKQFLNARNFMWNSGMFMWKAETIIQAFKEFAPEIYNAVSSYVSSGRKDIEAFQRAPAISVDYAIMEKSSKVGVIKGEFQWDDLGSWSSLPRVFPIDSNGNLAHGDHILIDAKGSVVYSEQNKIAAIGVQDLIIVQSGDYILIVPKAYDQRVKEVIDIIERKGEK